MVVNPPSELLDNHHPTSSVEVKSLISILAEQPLSIKEILTAMNLKDRENFMVNYLSPAIEEGFVTMLYPDKPKHPRQKYKLTVKGLAVYNSII